MLWWGPFSWGNGLPHFGITPRVGVMESDAFDLACWGDSLHDLPLPTELG